MKYYAHTSDRGEYQLLLDHLQGVANLCRRFADSFGAGYLGYLAGILHDIGKYSDPFQQRIRGSQIRVDHSTAGAQWIVKQEIMQEYLGNKPLDKLLARALAHVISGHHGGLRNYGSIDEDGSLQQRLSKQSDVPDWSQAWTEVKVAAENVAIPRLLSPSNVTEHNIAWKYSFFGRMLYSALVDADTIDTRNFCEGIDPKASEHSRYPSIEQLQQRYDAYMQQTFADSKDTIINHKRKQIREACERQANLTPRLFSLSVPTGGGKTLSTLSFALRHAVQYGMRRVIYVIPFTSIIEQNANQFRDAVGVDAVLEHHSNVSYEEYEEHNALIEGRRLKLSAENWDAPLVVTTSVQFFESLFANKRSKCRKLHNITNSVIIVDEAQSIPRDYLTPCLLAMQELTESYGCSVVLCTATQPTWEKLGFPVSEIMDSPTPEQLTEDFKRVEIEVKGRSTEYVPDSQIVEWLEAAEQILCIVNTRKHAKLLYDQLKERSIEGVYHLSGRMCAKHRSIILTEVRTRLLERLPCRVVSTQLIEAGVDVDFPKVLRALAGIDSIAQAAGRCNREGRLQRGHVIVFYPEKHGMPSRGWMKETAIGAQHELAYSNDPLSLECIHHYFERIHGIRSNQIHQLTDAKQIMQVFERARRNFEIPYEDIADRFKFIEEITQSVVIPYDDTANDCIHELTRSPYPMSNMRKLQPYVVQIYQHEFIALQKLHVIRNVAGVLCLTEKGYYSEESGLLTPADTPEVEVLIF